jgi:hypothetical protein
MAARAVPVVVLLIGCCWDRIGYRQQHCCAGRKDRCCQFGFWFPVQKRRRGDCRKSFGFILLLLFVWRRSNPCTLVSTVWGSSTNTLAAWMVSVGGRSAAVAVAITITITVGVIVVSVRVV